MAKRRAAAAGVVSVALVAGGALGARALGGDPAQDDPEDEPRTDLATAEVTVRDLEQRTQLRGLLGYGEPRAVSLAAEGTVTALPAIGTVVDRGQQLVEVDGRAVPLLFGPRPLWRRLGHVTEEGRRLADGPDVEQLEANLVAMGLASPQELTVDRHWTAVTTTIVRRWQASLGREQTGVVAPGDVAMLPGVVRVAGHPTPVGGSAGGPVVEVTDTARRVSVDLPADRLTALTAGQAVEVVFPDTTALRGTVESIGRVAVSTAGPGGAPEGGQPPTIEVTIVLDAADAQSPTATAFDQAPVTVRAVTSAVTAALAVPVDALTAQGDDRYAVEVVRPGDATELVPVETGVFADGWVQLVGDDLGVAEGDEVVVPS